MGDESTSRQVAKHNDKLTRLEPLVGAWTVTVDYRGETIDGGSAVFEWVEGGAFLRERSVPIQPEFPSGTVLIGADDSSETYTALYFDSRGVARVYLMSLDQGVWKLWRDAPDFPQRFRGTFSEDGRTITACWEKATDGTNWELDFDLTYRRAD
jgi:hypothetical protein